MSKGNLTLPAISTGWYTEDRNKLVCPSSLTIFNPWTVILLKSQAGLAT